MNTFLLSIYKRYQNLDQFSKLSIIAVIIISVLVLVSITTTHLLFTQADTNNAVKVEAETGSVTSETEKLADTSASAGQDVSFAANSATGCTKFVATTGSDANSGTDLAHAWQTLNHATQTAVAGDTVCFADGTYNSGPVLVKNSGTQSAPITFKSLNPKGATLSFSLAAPNSISGWDIGFHLGTPYVNIRDFNITVVQSTIASGYNTYAVRAETKGFYNLPGCDYCQITGNKIYVNNIGVKPNGDHMLVEGNDIENGVDSVGSNDVTVRNNAIHMHYYAGNKIGTAVELKGGSRNGKIYNNYIYIAELNGGFTGISLGAQTTSSTAYNGDQYEGYNNYAWNNVITEQATNQGPWTAGLQMQGCYSCGYYNNVVVNAYQAFMSVLGGTDVLSTNYNPVWKNNIVLDSSRSYVESSGSITGTATIDYNVFYNSNGYYRDVPQQLHPISGNPLVINEFGDWHVQSGSPAIGSGQVIGSLPAYTDVNTPLLPTVTVTSANPCTLVNGDWNCNGTSYQRASAWDLGMYDHRNTCTDVPPTDTGTDTVTFSVPSTFSSSLSTIVWTRMMSPSTANNAVYIKLNTPNSCAMKLTDSLGTNQWDWVPKNNLILTPGQTYTATVYGADTTGVKLDTILLSQSTDAVCNPPQGTGDTCVTSPTNTPTQTLTPSPTSVQTPTPTQMQPTATLTPAVSLTPTPTSYTTFKHHGRK